MQVEESVTVCTQATADITLNDGQRLAVIVVVASGLKPGQQQCLTWSIPNGMLIGVLRIPLNNLQIKVH